MWATVCPIVGAVVGGPIGAAAGFAVQGILGKGLNRTASARYSVTGPWNKPVMTLVEKHGVFESATPRQLPRPRFGARVRRTVPPHHAAADSAARPPGGSQPAGSSSS